MRLATALLAAVLLPACSSIAVPSSEGDGWGEGSPGIPGEEDRSFSREGGYAAVSFLSGWERFDDDVGGDVIGTQDTTGVGVRAGYRGGARWALEAEWRSVDIDTSEVQGGFWDATAQGKLFLAEGRFQPYGLLGIGMVKGTEGAEDAGFLFRFGFGLDAYVTENVAAFAEFAVDAQAFSNSNIPDGTENDAHMALQVGVLFRF